MLFLETWMFSHLTHWTGDGWPMAPALPKEVNWPVSKNWRWLPVCRLSLSTDTKHYVFDFWVHDTITLMCLIVFFRSWQNHFEFEWPLCRISLPTSVSNNSVHSWHYFCLSSVCIYVGSFICVVFIKSERHQNVFVTIWPHDACSTSHAWHNFCVRLNDTTSNCVLDWTTTQFVRLHSRFFEQTFRSISLSHVPLPTRVLTIDKSSHSCLAQFLFAKDTRLML